MTKLQVHNKTMIYRLSVVLLACLPCNLVIGRAPNVLMIVVDDLRPMLGCYGDKVVQTPNIDQLARRSLVFDRAYCQYAKCGTSRLSIMTGLRPDSIGVFSNRDKDVSEFRRKNPGLPTLSQWLIKQGYDARSFGKIDHDGWHLDEHWSQPPFPGRAGEMLEIVESESENSATVIADRLNCPAIQSPDVADEHLFAGRMTRKVLEAMRSRPDGKSWFFAVGYRRPHLPFVAPKRYFDLYNPEQSWLDKVSSPPDGVPAFAWFNSDGYVGTARRVGMTMPARPTRTEAIHWNGYELRSYVGIPNQGRIDEETQLKIYHAYAACISFVDAQIGRLLDELKRTKQLQNTIVILFSDHGWHLGEHSAWGKMTNYEIATRVPMIISAPQLRTGRTETIVELVDVYPTLCELLGCSMPDHLEGDSFSQVLEGKENAASGIALSQYSRFGGQLMGRAVRTDRFRFVSWFDKKSGDSLAQELYDHESDPNERRNLVGNEEFLPIVSRLRETLESEFDKR